MSCVHETQSVYAAYRVTMGHPGVYGALGDPGALASYCAT